MSSQSKNSSESSLNANTEVLAEKDWRLIDAALVDSMLMDRQALQQLPEDLVKSRDSIQQELRETERVREKVQRILRRKRVGGERNYTPQ